MKNLLLVSSLALALSGCGGGGASVPVVPVVPVVVAPVALFATTPQLLPDLKAKYDALCGNIVQVQNALSVNLTGHTDGKKDLVFNLWCGQVTRGLMVTTPTLNGMVAFVQQVDGSFIDSTKEIFGVEMVDLGGVGNDAVVYDFNKDGYEDIVWATSSEDGRSLPIGFTGNNVQKVFMTSAGDGKYSTQKLGGLAYNYKVHLIDNELGGKDLASTFIGYGGQAEVWRYTNGWSKLSGYDWISNSLNVFFKKTSAIENSRIAISTAWAGVGIELHTRSSNNSAWLTSSSWSFPVVQDISMIGWNTELGASKLITVSGKDYVNPNFELGCELKRTPTENSISLMMLLGNEVIGGYKGGVLTEGGSSMISASKLMAFSVTNNLLTNIPISITNEVTNLNVLKMACEDLNGDGYDDILITSLGKGALPIVYLNDGLGNFNLVDTTKLPAPSTDYFDTSMSYVDITGDGIRDLLYWPVNRLTGNPSKVQYQLFKGLRTALATDKK